MMPDPAKPVQDDKVAVPQQEDTPQPAGAGSGAASALARMKQWERSRAKMREGSREKPAKG